MTRVLVAGVDTSTQSTKVRITDAATGEQVRFGQAKHPDGTSVNPEFWWEAFTKAAEQAGGLDDVAALAVGGQQHGMVILDKQGNVIRDAMLWNDTSSAPQAAALIASKSMLLPSVKYGYFLDRACIYLHHNTLLTGVKQNFCGPKKILEKCLHCRGSMV